MVSPDTANCGRSFSRSQYPLYEHRRSTCVRFFAETPTISRSLHSVRTRTAALRSLVPNRPSSISPKYWHSVEPSTPPLERHAVDATLAIAIARATTTSMADAGNDDENPAAAAAIAIGDHPDDAEIAATDNAILSATTRADYNRRMTTMEAYFSQHKAAAMFAAGHEYEGRVDVTKITAHDFKRFLMSDKQTIDGAQERKRFGRGENGPGTISP
jgi:hypothetical protein